MIDTTLLLEALEERRETLGSIRGDGFPLTWSEVAAQVNTHQATFSRIKAGQLPGPRTFQRILKWLGATDDQFESCGACGDDFSVIGTADLPVGDRDTEWDGGDATARIFEFATDKDGKVDVGFVSQAFLYRDPQMDPNEAQAYKLPFCDLVNGSLTIFPRAVAAVASGHGLAQSDIPDSEKKLIEDKICEIYNTVREKYEDWPPCPYAGKRKKDVEGDDFKEYSPEERERLAKSGAALPDGSFPIADCADLGNAIQAIGRAKDPDKAKAHIKKRKKALGCEDVDLPEGWSLSTEEDMDPENEPDCSCDPEDEAYDEDCECEGDEAPKTAAIIGVGKLSDSKDERTAALVTRVRELLTEGAVGVSIRHDLDPDDMPSRDQIQALMDGEQFDELDALMSGVNARPRHVAIVDTAAFSDARLRLGKDGFTVEGPVTFEGIWTGDVRDMPYGGLVWENVLPIPIIWDPENNDHDGVVVGYISELERVDGMTTGVRPEAVETEDVEAVVAAAGSDRLPARYFDKFAATGETALTISEPDATGLRHVFGHVVPHGVCHRSDMSPCFQYPGDVDPQHKGFHTGSPVTLDDGSVVRVGALTIGGPHIDPKLARGGVTFRDVNRHRDDSNKVLAMVRVWEDRYGLAMSGVVLPGVSRRDLMAAKACAPSVELWPKGSGRTLVGVHLVPTPAWPVAASAGSAEYQTMATSVTVLGDLETAPPEPSDDLSDVKESLARIEKALAMLAKEVLTDVPVPEDAPVNE